MIIIALSIIIAFSLVILSIRLVSKNKTSKAIDPVVEAEQTENKDKKQYTKHNKLKKSDFEDYIIKNKAFLKPDIGIKETADQLNTNHSTLSTFIKNTYGVNFARFINTCRLKELERLRNLLKNKNKDIKQLVTESGFGSYRNYLRAKQMEEEEEND